MRLFNSTPRDSSRAFVSLARASESGCKVNQLTWARDRLATCDDRVFSSMRWILTRWAIFKSSGDLEICVQYNNRELRCHNSWIDKSSQSLWYSNSVLNSPTRLLKISWESCLNLKIWIKYFNSFYCVVWTFIRNSK